MKARKPRRWAARLIPAAVLVLVATAGGCSRACPVDSIRQFEQACRVFEAARDASDYQRAAALFESIIHNGCHSGAVLFNLGNAYLRAGMVGRAIAAYRQAQRLMPRDEFLAANLRQALGPDRAGTEDERSLFEHVFFWQRTLSYPEKVLAVGGGGSVTFLLAVLARLLIRRRRTLRRATAAAFLVTLVLGVSCGVDAYGIELVRHGVVAADEVVARKGGAESYQPAFTESLEEGAEFVVVQERGSWLQIRLDGRLDGWVPRDKTVIY